MGILRGTARLLFEEHKRQPFEGSLLELGKMIVFLTPDEIDRWAREHGIELADVEARLSHDPQVAAHGCIDDRTFFTKLGFDEVRSSDAVRWEGADLILDLNQPADPELHERFDVVFEGGTIQHVFDLPQVLRNIHAVLKPGGRVIHGILPSNNHVDLGFYMFSPTLFLDYYNANGWRIETFHFFDYIAYWTGAVMRTTRFQVRDYKAGCLDPLSYGRIGNRQIGLFVVATKTDEATCDVAPQQGFYRQHWQQTAETEVVKPETEPAGRCAPPNPLVTGWKLGREIVRRWGPKKLPPVIARY